MQLTDLLVSELDREAVGTRKVLERVPDDRHDWKPHEKSMTLGHLSGLVAIMPGWVEQMIGLDELDFMPGGKPHPQPELRTTRQLVEAFDASIAKAQSSLRGTTDEHLMTPWRLLAAGRVMSENSRYINIRDGIINHLAHHRGQLTVYLRLIDAMVPAIYGPSADERP